MMSVVTALVVVAVLAKAGKAVPAVPAFHKYHDEVGIPKLEEITQYEQGLGRIGGGTVVTAGAQPHLAGIVISLTNGQTSMCGGSLLTNTRTLTAAHCWYDGWRQASNFEMVYGSSFLRTGGVRVNTNQVVMHENWNTWTFQNDIAVVTHSWVEYTNVIQRILLPSGSDLDRDFAGALAVAAGFGAIQDGPPAANPDKRQATLRVITNTECRQIYGPTTVVDSTLCVSGAEGSNICSGDSGGPLAIGSGDSRVLIGVTSFGSMQCNSGMPGGFARVTYYLSWIVMRII